MNRSKLLAAATAAMLPLAASLPTAAGAQPVDFGKRPVRIIVPFAPGGASDFVGRIIQPRLAEELGTQVLLDNRAGAAGNIGVEVAARATPDGFTLLLGNVGTMAINPSLYPDFAYKPTKHFIPVTQVVDVPGALVSHPSLPPNSVADLIAAARAHALIGGRPMVLPEDVQRVFPAVAGHRLAGGARTGALQAQALLRAVAIP